MQSKNIQILILITLVLSGCALPEGMKLRNNYMGQDFLEKIISIKPVSRDELGKPVP